MISRRHLGQFSQAELDQIAEITARIANPPKLPKPPKIEPRPRESDGAAAARRDFRLGAFGPRLNLTRIGTATKARAARGGAK